MIPQSALIFLNLQALIFCPLLLYKFHKKTSLLANSSHPAGLCELWEFHGSEYLTQVFWNTHSPPSQLCKKRKKREGQGNFPLTAT